MLSSASNGSADARSIFRVTPGSKTPRQIRIRPGALADGQPTRDLYLSPEHCLILDGLCIPAKLLINGATITSERSHPPFTYYHIELDRHGILVAENALAESYLDTGNRSLFENAGEPHQLHPSFTVNADADRWLTEACAPLVRASDQLEPIWRRLAERSARMGLLIPAIPTSNDADVHILADGRRINPVADGDCRWVFTVPAGVTSVALASRCCIPADRMLAGLRDQRRLGVSVSWIAIRSRNCETVLPPDHPALQEGWNDVERSTGKMWRWTEGVAAIPWENIPGPAMLTIRCAALDHYPIYAENMVLAA